MGLLDKGRTKPSNTGTELTQAGLTKEDFKFILAKLRLADYKGTEFEAFYAVYTKIQDHINNQK